MLAVLKRKFIGKGCAFFWKLLSWFTTGMKPTNTSNMYFVFKIMEICGMKSWKLKATSSKSFIVLPVCNSILWNLMSNRGQWWVLGMKLKFCLVAIQRIILFQYVASFSLQLRPRVYNWGDYIKVQTAFRRITAILGCLTLLCVTNEMEDTSDFRLMEYLRQV